MLLHSLPISSSLTLLHKWNIIFICTLRLGKAWLTKIKLLDGEPHSIFSVRSIMGNCSQTFQRNTGPPFSGSAAWFLLGLLFIPKDLGKLSSSETSRGLSPSTLRTTVHHTLHRQHFFFPLALQPQFGPWPTSMKLSVSLQVTRSWTFGRTPWVCDQFVARPLPVHKHRKTHIHKH
jgi:hypothetical protein